MISEYWLFRHERQIKEFNYAFCWTYTGKKLLRSGQTSSNNKVLWSWLFLRWEISRGNLLSASCRIQTLEIIGQFRLATKQQNSKSINFCDLRGFRTKTNKSKIPLNIYCQLKSWSLDSLSALFIKRSWLYCQKS